MSLLALYDSVVWMENDSVSSHKSLQQDVACVLVYYVPALNGPGLVLEMRDKITSIKSIFWLVLETHHYRELHFSWYSGYWVRIFAFHSLESAVITGAVKFQIALVLDAVYFQMSSCCHCSHGALTNLLIAWF